MLGDTANPNISARNKPKKINFACFLLPSFFTSLIPDKLSAMKVLTQTEKDKFLEEHFRHRLTLLCTLRDRKMRGYNDPKHGDIYRCVKDSSLIAIRLWLNFFGLNGEEYKKDNYKLNRVKRKQGEKYENDIMIDQFIDRWLDDKEVASLNQQLLGGVYCRADKELAHMTNIFNDDFNEEDVLIQAATAVEDLIQKFLYNDKPLPETD